MPRQLRMFDHIEEQYKVWALVRHVKPAAPAESKALLFEVGVAFIGKTPPRSYEDDPAKRYQIAGLTRENLSVAEDWVPFETSSSDKRTQTRHGIPVDMFIETFNDKGEVELSEYTVTENISQKGAAIYTTLSLAVGRFVRLSSEQYKISIYAAVRGQSIGPTGIPRVHVEFVDREWPL